MHTCVQIYVPVHVHREKGQKDDIKCPVYPFSPVLLRQYLYLNLGLALSQLNWNSDTHTDPPVSASLQSWGYRFMGCPVCYVGAGIQNSDLCNHVTNALNL